MRSISATTAGRKERLVYATNGARVALAGWIGTRGTENGALFCLVDKAGRVHVRRMTDQAMTYIPRKRAEGAGGGCFTTYDDDDLPPP